MKTLMNNITKLLVFGLVTQIAIADPGWDANGDGVLENYNDYENNGSVTAKVYPDGVEGGQLGDMVAAFVDGEQRGVAPASEVPFFLGNGYAFLMMVYSNATSGEMMNFQYYNSATNAVYNTAETLEFTVNMVEGDVEIPFQLNYSPGDGPSDVPGCTDESACNYDSSATSDNGSCSYPEDNYDCAGNCTAEVDCAGNCAGDAVEDNCGTCDSDSSNDCTQDCAGTWGGDATTDNCGTCDSDSSNDCTEDCAGVWGGINVVDNCDDCVVPGNECVQDCNGEWGGTAFVDNCDACVASEDEACTVDCNGDFGGDALEDNCGTCDNDPSNDCTQDCAGVWGGSAVIDNCDVCDNNLENDCIQDCFGVWGGIAVIDNCGVCGGDSADIDEDNICDNIDDCVGYYDDCGVCNGDNTYCGCMDPIALNYNSASIVDDQSCYYFDQNIYLRAGWNMISLSVLPDNYPSSNLFDILFRQILAD